MKSWGIWLVLAAILAIQIGLLASVARSGRVTDAIANKAGVPPESTRIMRNKEGKPMGEFHTSWMTGENPAIEIKIDLYQQDDEDAAEWAQRCLDTVNAMKAAFPPIG